MKICVLAALAVIVGALQIFSAGGASAEELTWRFKSEHKNVVSVKLYSDQRDHVWPNEEEVYTLDDYTSREVTISCIAGEKVCYGAWVAGTESVSWGAGRGGKADCKECCYACEGGQTPVLVLN